MNYSFIIPHHDIPSLLKRCLDSIPQRDDVQVIVVDDCSDEIYKPELRQLENTYSQYEFIYLDKNVGGGRARNIGLDYAKGNYIIFADADDYFNDCISEILDDYKNTDYDQVYFKANSVDSVTAMPAYRANHLNSYVDLALTGQDPEGKHLRYLFGEPWARIINRSMINEHHICFEETMIHNDTAFGYLSGYYSKKIAFDQRALYCVTVRQHSVSVLTSPDRILTRIAVFGRGEIFLTSHKIDFFPAEHYEQLFRLARHGHIITFFKGIKTLQQQGLSLSRIFYRLILTFYQHILNKTKNNSI